MWPWEIHRDQELGLGFPRGSDEESHIYESIICTPVLDAEITSRVPWDIFGCRVALKDCVVGITWRDFFRFFSGMEEDERGKKG